MPNIDLIDVPLYGPDDPYHFEFDNIPLKALIQREELINLALDNLIQQVQDANGTQGSMANRLNQSLNPDGTIKVAAIDSANHSIANHADDTTYVRMLRAESDKLALVADGATDFGVEVQLDDAGTSIQTFTTGNLRVVPSQSVSWTITAPNKLKANLNFPLESAHQHHYDQDPVPSNFSSPDYINYQVNGISTAFMSNTLRVYINGVRISQTDTIYVPGALVTDPWTLISFTASPADGTFALSAAITPADIIRIDYDTSYS